MPRDARRMRKLLPLLAALAALAAGCADPDGSTEDVGAEVNNDVRGGAPMSGDDTGQCIHTTTGEATTDAETNPCPQGEYPEG